MDKPPATLLRDAQRSLYEGCQPLEDLRAKRDLMYKELSLAQKNFDEADSNYKNQLMKLREHFLYLVQFDTEWFKTNLRLLVNLGLFREIVREEYKHEYNLQQLTENLKEWMEGAKKHNG